jgi:hypothetical protein
MEGLHKTPRHAGTSARASLRYLILTGRGDMFWLPAALWALFAIITGLMRGDQALGAAVWFIGGVLPLIGGILAAYAVLDDPALELRFATPRPAAQVLLERLAPVLATLIVAALAFQLFAAAVGLDLGILGGPAARQAAWLVPCLAMLALGTASALILAGTTPGAMLVGLIWIFQIVARGWFNAHRWARYFGLFLGISMPDHPMLHANQAVLVGLSVLLLLGARALLARQERYL